MQVDTDCAARIKEELCYVSSNYAEEAASFEGNEKQFPLPDGQALTVGKQQITAPEIIFTPKLGDSNVPGLHQIVYKVLSAAEASELTDGVWQTVMDCEYESRRDLYANIVVSGGTSLLKNFPERLQREVCPMQSVSLW